MDEKEVKEIIDSKIADAKLVVAEKRLHFVMWLGGAILAVFGVLYPLLQSNHAADKVDAALDKLRLENNQAAQDFRVEARGNRESLDKTILAIRSDVRAEAEENLHQIMNTSVRVDNSIQDMHKQFKELAGAQARKPAIEFFVDKLSLEGSLQKISSLNNNTLKVVIKNTGDAPAQNILLRIYSNFPDNYIINGWNNINTSDEPSFTQAFESSFYRLSLDPKESQILDLNIFSNSEKQKPGNYACLLKAFYGQPEPTKCSFTIDISEK